MMQKAGCALLSRPTALPFFDAHLTCPEWANLRQMLVLLTCHYPQIINYAE